MKNNSKLKKPKVVFDAEDGGGLLSVYFYPGPYGAAEEASSGEGVLFCAPNGEVLAAIFDYVEADGDSQVLRSPHADSVVVKTHHGKVIASLVPSAGRKKRRVS